MKKNNLINILIVLAVLILALIILLYPKSEPNTDEQTAKCIGENSILYVQVGCPHCRTQEEMFGENLEHITIVDCWEQKELCTDIIGTPSWKISNEIYRGVREINELKNLTGC